MINCYSLSIILFIILILIMQIISSSIITRYDKLKGSFGIHKKYRIFQVTTAIAILSCATVFTFYGAKILLSDFIENIKLKIIRGK